MEQPDLDITRETITKETITRDANQLSKRKHTLIEAINKQFNVIIVTSGKNFGIKGWCYSKMVSIHCEACGENFESFKCFYSSQKKNKSYHWALYCKKCHTVISPSKLEVDQRILLYNTVDNVIEERKDNIIGLQCHHDIVSENDDRDMLNNIFFIVRKMRESKSELSIETPIDLISRVVNMMQT